MILISPYRCLLKEQNNTPYDNPTYQQQHQLINHFFCLKIIAKESLNLPTCYCMPGHVNATVVYDDLNYSPIKQNKTLFFKLS